MSNERTEVLLWGPPKPTIVKGLEAAFKLHKLVDGSGGPPADCSFGHTC